MESSTGKNYPPTQLIDLLLMDGLLGYFGENCDESAMNQMDAECSKRSLVKCCLSDGEMSLSGELFVVTLASALVILQIDLLQ